MNECTDQQLLREYAEQRSESAFGELVRRHIDLVHSAAFRMTGEAHSAQDITQAVFVALAQNAARLTQHPVLSGWLHTTARNLAAKSVRAAVRRQHHEQEAAAMNELLSTAPDASWEEIAPVLDDALGELSEADRDTVLLRYFEKKSVPEMARILGLSDAAAQKRVSRAVERLREFFSKRKITVGAGGLTILISANAVQSAPVGFAATICAGALASVGGTATTLSFFNLISMTTLQAAIVGVALTALVVTPLAIHNHAQIKKLKSDNTSLRQQVGQLANLNAENERLSNLLATANSSPSLLVDQRNELLRLRAEVTRLNQEVNETENSNSDLSPVEQAALAKLRSSASTGEAFGAFDALRKMAPAPEILSSLAQIMKVNPFAARAIASGDGLSVIAGRDSTHPDSAFINFRYSDNAKKVDAAFRPLLQDSNATVRQAAAYVLGQVLGDQAGPDVIRVAIEGLKSEDEDLLVSGMSTLSNAGQDRNDRMNHLTNASLGASAQDAAEALLKIVKNTQRPDLRDDAMRLLSSLNPDLSQADSVTQASFKESQQVAAFLEKLQTRQATLPEIIAGLGEFPDEVPAAARALAQMGSEARTALPDLQKALAAMKPPTEASGAVRGTVYGAREEVANAIQKIASDQPKVLFTQSDMRDVMQILYSPEIRNDPARRQRVFEAIRPVQSEAPGHGVELTPEQMRSLLHALNNADKPTYDAVAALVTKIDPNFRSDSTR